MAAPSTVTSIRIKERWGGLNPAAPLKGEWTIDATPGGFRLRGEATEHDIAASMGDGDEHRKVTATVDTAVPAASVDALVRAMRAPATNHMDIDAMGVDPAAAQRVLDEEAAPLLAQAKVPALASRIRAWRKGLKDPLAVGRALAIGATKASHTDDFPAYGITVTMSDGSKLTADTHSQNVMMLPWYDDQHRQHFEPALPRALHALLPPGSPNAQRLADAIDPDELENLLGWGIASERGRLSAEAKAPAAVAALDARFQVREIEIAREGTSVMATVGLASLPANVTLDIDVPLDNGTVAGALIDEAVQMLTLAGSAPAMAAAFHDAPDDTFSMSLRDAPGKGHRVHHGIGLSRAERELFLTQMHDGRQLTDVDDADASVLMQAVEVSQGFNPVTWIVLGDHRAIRWQEFTLGKGKGGPRCRSPASLPSEDDPFERSFESLDGTCYREVFDTAGHAVPPSAQRYVPRLVRMEIDDTWNGVSLDAPRNAHWEVVPEGAGYRVRGTATATFEKTVVARVDNVLPTERVAPLLGALWAPNVPTVDPAVLRVDEHAAQAMLDKRAAALARRAITDDFRARIRAWRDELRTPTGFAAAVTRGTGGLAIDDYPEVTLKADFADGSHVGFHSVASGELMFPWFKDKGADTYDPALPRTLGALLPASSPNHDRLTGPVAPDTTGALVAIGTHHAYAALEAEAEAPAAVARLRDAYDVSNLSVSHDGKVGYLSATLRRPAVSPKLNMAIDIPLAGGMPRKEDLAAIEHRWTILASAKRMLIPDGIGSVHVLTTRYRTGAAFAAREASDRVLLLAQMHAADRMKDLRADSPALAQAFLVKDTSQAAQRARGMGPPDTSGQVWMVLGDGRSIIWQRYEEPDVTYIKPCHPRESAIDDPVPAKAWCVLEDFQPRPLPF